MQVPREPTYGTAAAFPRDFREAINSTCRHLWRDNLATAYPYLTRDTAARHVVAAVGYTPIVVFCAMAGMASRPPRSAALLSRMRFLVHEEFGSPEGDEGSTLSRHTFTHQEGQRPGIALNVPFPSAIHDVAVLRSTLRLGRRRSGGATGGAAGGRTTLLSFTGSLNGSPQGKALRTTIAQQCAERGPPDCAKMGIPPGMEVFKNPIVELYQHKRSATFCAEPGGLNLIRKGVVDAALNGCIPVLFLDPVASRRLWP